MIYHQQQRSKEKLSPSDSKKEDEPQHTSSSQKLPDLITHSRPLLPPSSTSDLPLPLPSAYQTPLLPPPAFSTLLRSDETFHLSFFYLDYRSPFDFAGMNNGPFGRVPPSSATAFGGLGSLFPPPPPPSSLSSTIDRKSDMNGSVAAAAALGLDWSRFHRGMGSLPPPPPSSSSLMPSLPPPLATNENSSLKKLDEVNNSNNDKYDFALRLLFIPTGRVHFIS